MSLGKSDPPPAPDYRGAAVATAQGNLEATRAATAANRIAQYTPYGSLTYERDPNAATPDDGWSQYTTLSPSGQRLFDIQQGVSEGLGNLSTQGLGYVQNTLNRPFDWAGVPQVYTPDFSSLGQAPVNPGMTGQNAILARLNPTLDRQREMLQTQLANQGISAGSDAYTASMRDQAMRENDLYSQAALQGISLDSGARQQAFNELLAQNNNSLQNRQQGIQEQSFARNEPLNMLNAVRSGAQAQLPQFSNFAQQQTTGGPNYMGAAQAQGQYDIGAFNAQQAQEAAMLNAVAQIGGAAMTGGASLPFSLGGSAAGMGGGGGLRASGLQLNQFGGGFRNG